MARIYQGLIRIVPSFPKPSSSVRVSVIIPTNKGPQAVGNLLGDLRKQNYNHDAYEVIIADDSNGIWTGDAAKEWADVPGFKVIESTGRGKKRAIDTAIEAASGELIITTDDDCRVGPEWVLAIASHYNQSRPGMIICPVELTDDSSFFARIQQLEFLSLQGVTAGSASLGDPIMCNGAGLAFRRDLYPGAGALKDESLVSGDDMFLLHYLKKKGVVIEWAESESVMVRTDSTRSICRFIRQRSRWASKSIHYSDPSTITTGLSVLIASFVIATYMVLSFFNPGFVRTALLLLLIKSVPDYLIIMNRLQFHSKTEIIVYLPVVQLVYPFYAIISAATGLLRKSKW